MTKKYYAVDIRPKSDGLYVIRPENDYWDDAEVFLLIKSITLQGAVEIFGDDIPAMRNAPDRVFSMRFGEGCVWYTGIAFRHDP
jgi:hypothetical protein